MFTSLGDLSLSHNSDLVSDIEGIMFRGNDDVCLFETVWSDECVNSADLDVIEFLASFLDHWLVGSSVNDEHQCIAVFNGLDGAFGTQRILNDGVLVPGLFLLNTLSRVLWFTSKSQSLWSSEGSVGPHFVLSNGMASLLHCL